MYNHTKGEDSMDSRHSYRSSMTSLIAVVLALAAALSCAPEDRPVSSDLTDTVVAPGPRSSAQATSAYTLFESGQVRPLALSPDGKRLFAVNTPDNRLEIFRVKHGGLVHQASVPVGLEPVAVAARSNSEVWVVNHLSDSVSVVALDQGEH